MAGENPDKLKEGQVPDERDFVAKSVGARAAIAFAGPFINIVFAFLLLMVLYMVGVEEADNKNLIVGFVANDSSAEIAGIQPGDTYPGLGRFSRADWREPRCRGGAGSPSGWRSAEHYRGAAGTGDSCPGFYGQAHQDGHWRYRNLPT